MTFIVALTGGFGLLASFVLLRAGLESMALRYPLALGLAYGFFLFLLWLWLRTRADDYADVPDLAVDLPGRGTADALPAFKSGGGGDFGGGGASASFDAPGGAADAGLEAPLRSAGEAVGSVVDADELAIPLLAVALALGLALASLYVVYIAPLLFAELLVDGALSYALYRRLYGQDPQHWLAHAWRRTRWPFAATAVFLCVSGLALAAYAPGAASLGDVVTQAGARKAAR
jgi:hypothetical protein